LLSINNRRATWKTKKDGIRTKLTPDRDNPTSGATRVSKVQVKDNPEITIPIKWPLGGMIQTCVPILKGMTTVTMILPMRAIRSLTQLNR
jgi:hypothetical protein